MKKKKKKGSALVLVMVFSLVFIVISGLASVSVVNTFKANGAESQYESLYYAAESGVERALARAKTGMYDDYIDIKSTSFKSTDTFKISNLDKSDVTVTVTGDGDKDKSGNYTKTYLSVVSTSEMAGGQKRTVKAKVFPWADSSNLFRYNICGQKVTAGSEGAVNFGTSLINSSLEKYDGKVEGSYVEGKEENIAFSLPEFTSEVPKKTELTINLSATDKLETKLESMVGKDVIKIEYTTVATSKSAGGAKFNLYLINADTVKVESDTPQTLTNVMILTNGEIDINSGVSGLNLSNSSIIGKKVNVEKGTVSMTFPPFDYDHPDRFGTNSVLCEEDVSRLINGWDDGLNKYPGISHYAPNLAIGGGSGSIGSHGYIASEYE